MNSVINFNYSSENKLLISLKEGDRNAFSLIYNTYWKRLLAVSYSHLKDKTLAEEVVQEVFISLWNRRMTLEIKSLESYLATAVKFATFKAIQRMKRHAEIENNLAKTDTESVSDDYVDAKFLKEYVEGVVESLPDKCQLVFKLSRESYLTNKEISQNLSISEKSVEAHITRALRVLKYNLQRAGILSLILFLS